MDGETKTTPSDGRKVDVGYLRWLREMFENMRRSVGVTPTRWVYGHTAHGAKARRHRLTGRVEFVLWPAGHPRGYPDREFWAPLGAGHEFIPEEQRP